MKGGESAGLQASTFSGALHRDTETTKATRDAHDAAPEDSYGNMR